MDLPKVRPQPINTSQPLPLHSLVMRPQMKTHSLANVLISNSAAAHTSHGASTINRGQATEHKQQSSQRNHNQQSLPHLLHQLSTACIRELGHILSVACFFKVLNLIRQPVRGTHGRQQKVGPIIHKTWLFLLPASSFATQLSFLFPPSVCNPVVLLFVT